MKPTVANLCTALSEVLGIDRTTVAVAARRLQEAKLLPTGKGGRNKDLVPEVDENHCARLILAIFAGVSMNRAGEIVHRLWDLPLTGITESRTLAGASYTREIPKDDPVSVGFEHHTLGTILAGTIRQYRIGYRGGSDVAPAFIGLHRQGEEFSANIPVLLQLQDEEGATHSMTFNFGPTVNDHRALSRMVTMPGAVFPKMAYFLGSIRNTTLPPGPLDDKPFQQETEEDNLPLAAFPQST